MFYFKIAIKSIIERRQQYKSLFAVCAVGICLMLFALTVTDGMLSSMNEKARQYYGGDLQFLGGPTLFNTKSYADETIAKLEKIIDDDDVVFYERFVHDAKATRSSFYFEGMSVNQRVAVGVDFQNESDLFGKFTFEEGSFFNEKYTDTVLISAPIAKKLGCHVGDSITFYTKTKEGYNNTIDLVVSGIFHDSSIFGMYTSYVNYDSLMRVLNYTTPLVDRISFYYKHGAPSEIGERLIQSKLEENFDMYPFGMDKQEFYDDFLEKNKNNGKNILVTLESNVSELKLLVQALKLIVFLIVLMLVIIVSVGISSTYRVIVIKRTVESGTLRALGMKPSGIMKMFVSEAFLLLVSGAIIGLILSAIFAFSISRFDLSFISGFDLFLTGGRLAPSFSFVKILMFISIIVVTTLLSVLFTLRKLVRVSPVGAITATT